MKQLLGQSRPYKLIIGARDLPRTQAAYRALGYDESKHSISVLPLDLASLKTVKSFAEIALGYLGNDTLDILFLNAGMNKAATEPLPDSSTWCEAYLVNHLGKSGAYCISIPADISA
jgi:NAD(P)-dependent dehydrogenase (short-subunit alcohol dehydrogenase family)